MPHVVGSDLASEGSFKISGFRLGPKIILIDLNELDLLCLSGYPMVALASDAHKTAKGRSRQEAAPKNSANARISTPRQPPRQPPTEREKTITQTFTTITRQDLHVSGGY